MGGLFRLLPGFRPYFAAALLMLSAASFGLTAQQLPNRIRGYKVYKKPVLITGDDTGTVSPIDLKFDAPVVAGVSLSGVTIELPAEITSSAETGRVEFIAFHDFRINGLPIEINDYDAAFVFQKGRRTELPKPIVIRFGTLEILKAAYREHAGSRDEWLVTGRVIVFGKFRKFGFEFKRAIPVDVAVKLKDPSRHRENSETRAK
jgi:hypothetical protein